MLPSRPAHVLAFGTSMGGLVSALEAQQGAGKINGALTTCGIVGGGVNLNEYQIDGEYAIAQLLGNPSTQLVGFGDDTTALATASALTADATAAQTTAAGRARLALALAFLNTTPWLSTSTTPVPASDPNGQEAAQYNVMFGGGFSIMDFIELGRVSVDQADGGNATWDVGTNFARALAGSPFKNQVEALYKEAGLNLNGDLATLTANTTIKADPAALRSLVATSVPTGRLAVPELDLHTIGDNLVPVQNENYYPHLVDQAGSGSLLRQAYTESFGHCNFSPAELVAGVLARPTGSPPALGRRCRPCQPQPGGRRPDLGPARFAVLPRFADRRHRTPQRTTSRLSRSRARPGRTRPRPARHPER